MSDAGIRKLLGDLGEVERKHQEAAEALMEAEITPDAGVVELPGGSIHWQ